MSAVCPQLGYQNTATSPDRARRGARRLLAWPGRVLAPVVSIVTGCLNRDVNRPEHFARGCVFMLPGIEGTAWQLRGMVAGLRDAGIGRALEIIEWGSHPLCQWYNLCAFHANRRRAGQIAVRIAEYSKAHPRVPVTLLGYSGGGGIAVLVAEALPPELRLDRIILISAAVSPGYPLAGVLSKGSVVNYFSPRDWLILGLGTAAFGTIDRRWTHSAGRVGFRDSEGTLLNREGLCQIPWRPEWAELGHVGGHIGWLSRNWAARVLAPVIAPG